MCSQETYSVKKLEDVQSDQRKTLISDPNTFLNETSKPFDYSFPINKPIKILTRPCSSNNESSLDLDVNKIIFPKLPYHKRWELYRQKRDEIFNVSSLTTELVRKPKRSTLRMRKFYRNLKICRKFLVSTVVSNPTDMRYYAKVRFLDFEEVGLLDTGANISCVGAELALCNFSKFSNFVKCKNFVKTADGKAQSVLGWTLRCPF